MYRPGARDMKPQRSGCPPSVASLLVLSLAYSWAPEEAPRQGVWGEGRLLVSLPARPTSSRLCPILVSVPALPPPPSYTS
jgi:hypothetical protein